jgi:RND family efflux transporter MFP subunit
MKTMRNVIGLIVLMALIGGVWIVRFHSDWLKASAKEEEGEAVTTEVPVQTAKITRATLRRYIEGFGTVEPEPARGGHQAAGAAIAAPVAGIVAEVLCACGQHVAKGAVLVQLDERLAKATEEQAAAALESARAGLAKLKSTPRPEQLEVAQFGVEKARRAVEFSEKGYERQQKLATQQGTSEKSLQTAELELATARNELKVAERQFVLLKSSPTPEELGEAKAKVNEGDKALAVAQTQRSLLKIQAPLDATVVRVLVNPGEAVDATKVLAELVALDRLVVNASVSVEDLASLQVGLPVEIIAKAATGKAASAPAASQPAGSATKPAEDSVPSGSVGEGTVYFISPQVDRKTDTVAVGVALPAKTGLRPGQYVRVRIAAEEHKDRLAVPRESVVTNGEGGSVIAIVDKGKAVQKAVEVGLREGDLIEIEGDGLHEGDTVVTAGAYGLPKETKVRLVKE